MADKVKEVSSVNDLKKELQILLLKVKTGVEKNTSKIKKLRRQIATEVAKNNLGSNI